MSHSQWNILPAVPEEYLDTAGFPRLLSQILYNRGLTDTSQLESFLAIDNRLTADPFLLANMHQATARIFQALFSGEKIAIYGDFDADGITATALLVQGLSLLDCDAVPYIPHRVTEGYGLNDSALEKLYQQDIRLVITVDCGITALPEITRAKKRGLGIIITDHHVPPETIPPADAVVDPKLPGSDYPFPELAGVGVAYKLLQALFQGIGQEEQLHNLTDLVALGTVADMAPLIGENRYLVNQGLSLLRFSSRPGIREIINQSGIDTENIDTRSISWGIAPRLNAAGRLDHAMNGYRLLMTDSETEAFELATWLEQKNAERQKLTNRALTKAREQVSAQKEQSLLIAADDDYTVGVTGLVASRLSDEFYRPAVVITTGSRNCTGSARSIPEFNIIKALTECSQLLSQFGGHSQAAGFSLPTSNLQTLQETLQKLAKEKLADIDLRPHLDIDAEVTLSELGGDTYPLIQRMAPFGQGNPEPVFASRRVEIIDRRTMGNNGEHLRFKLKQDDTLWDAVGFGLSNTLNGTAHHLDIVYNLELDRWGGEERLRLNILDMEPSR